MATIGKLAVLVDADTKGLGIGLKDAGSKIQDFERKTEKLSGSMSDLGDAANVLKGHIGALASAFSITAFAGKLIETQRQFDVLNASMVTISGSSQAAARDFAWLKEFAATTPFALNEVVGAFVKMSALGLEPSKQALESYGNTASAMGKSLNQMIEAVADASTGEFERLKEFGIKSKVEGENVSFTFQGVTTTIRNSSQEITRYLDDIGRNQFAGAMAERAKTLDGAISNLGDTWDELFRTINNSNVGGLIFDSVTVASKSIEQATKIIDAMSNAASRNRTETGAMAATLNGITTLLETVAVLGVNVAYVLEATGRELGGLAAQAAAVARLDFSGALTIGRLMKADAAAARAEVDRLTASILNSRNAYTAGPIAGGGSGQRLGMNDPRIIGMPASAETAGYREPPKPAATGGASNANAAADEAIKKAQEVEAFFAKVQEESRQREVNNMQAFVDGLRQREELRLQSAMSEKEIAEQNYQTEYERLIEAKEALALTEEEFTERLLQIRMDRDERIMNADIAMLNHEQRMADERTRINQQAEQIIAAHKEQTMNLAIGFLNTLGGKSKAAAIAAIALSKALAIAQATQNTAVAYTKALTLDPTGALAARTAMLGKIQIGLIAATGLAQAANVGGGGTVSMSPVSGGSSGGTMTSGGGMSASAMNQTITIQGVNSGDLFSGDAVRTLIDRLIDAQRNGARIVLA